MKLKLLFQGGKVYAERGRVAALEEDGHVVALINLLDSDVRGVTDLYIVRGLAASALGRLGDPRAIPYLIEMRHDPEDGVRMDVMRALGLLNTKPAENAACEGLSDPAVIVRQTAAAALGRMGAVDAIPVLRNASDSDPHPYARLYAIESLVVLGDKSARDRVAEAIRAIPRRGRRHPRWKRLQEAAESGEALTPWFAPYE